MARPKPTLAVYVLKETRTRATFFVLDITV